MKDRVCVCGGGISGKDMLINFVLHRMKFEVIMLEGLGGGWDAANQQRQGV